jgi:hypothetical protein
MSVATLVPVASKKKKMTTAQPSAEMVAAAGLDLAGEGRRS